MRTTYYLVTAAAVAVAALTVYAQLPNLNGPPPVADAAAPPEVPRLELPPVTLPPDEPLVMPAVPAKPLALPPLPTPDPVKPLVPPVAAVPVPLPSAPAITPAQATLPVPVAVPDLPPVKPAPVEPLVPPITPLPLPVPKPPETLTPPPAPLPVPAPVLQPPVLQPAPPVQPPAPAYIPPTVPAPARVPAEANATGGKYVVLKDDKLIEGAVTVNGDVVLVRHGALDRPFSKNQIQYVAESKDEVYRFMLAKVPATDTAARLKVARWCMFSGMREQALAEAREVQKLDPRSAGAADLVRSLELSLQQYPPDGSPRMVAPEKPTFPAEVRTAPPTPPVVEPEADVTPEAANLFATKVQPFLANQCVDCHAKPDHAGAFKLARVTVTGAGQQATRANLRAVAAQLRKDEPASSPLLLKALAAHGGQKLPAVASRQAVAYQTLEAWAALAVGTPVMGAPAVRVAPPVVAPPAVPVAEPVLPPVVAPVIAPPPPLVPTVPAYPPAPALPPAVEPVLPLPAPPAVPSVPAIPPADPLVLPVAPLPKPVVPPIPPATAGAPVPLPLVQPASGFGSTLPPKPPVSGPSGGDEFDPAGFNRGK